MALAGRRLEQLAALGGIGGNALAQDIKTGRQGAGTVVAGRQRQRQVGESPGRILGHALAGQVGLGQGQGGFRTALVGRRPVPA